MKIYENKEIKRDIKIQEALTIEEIMHKKESKIEEYIKNIDILNITPIEALNILYKLQEETKE